MQGGPVGTLRSAFAFLLLGALAGSALAGPGDHAATQYKLALSDAQEYRLRSDGEDYQLRAPWARPKAARQAGPSAAVSARLQGRPFHDQIAAAANAHGLDTALVHAVIVAESNYQKGAISPKGAIGLMQVMPETGARYGALRAKLAQAESNIGVGTRYLAELLQMFNGNLELALAAYNAGENAVMRHGNRIPPFAETRAYVKRVMQIYRDLRAS